MKFYQFQINNSFKEYKSLIHSFVSNYLLKPESSCYKLLNLFDIYLISNHNQSLNIRALDREESLYKEHFLSRKLNHLD